MRTIRTKVYQFSELSYPAKERAVKEESNRLRKLFSIQINGNIKGEFTPYELSEGKKSILANEYEFKADGTRF